ncbi:hypothetical protein FQ186_27890 [Pseudomonas sp. ANT_H14]|uniref:hypothetical protein n=1 Tax=unclassified Pseudomonas TaxID=196821 RepID=UPI0011ED87E7|nr:MULTISPECIES: hypothetical protein [unclassified Pseudomonas]KAA0941264.1 hypothetical protein FQ182_29180 [Pseudomonas sp. ANT_H4]KAA0945892.1 hypothetical protein FQ186_27890 [Pseudomonas sp. ANT_H14]
MGQKLTDTQVKSWALNGTVKKAGIIIPARTLSEQLGTRGAGSMLLERRPNGRIEVYLAMRREGRQERRKLGTFGELGPDGQIRGLSCQSASNSFQVTASKTFQLATRFSSVSCAV